MKKMKKKTKKYLIAGGIILFVLIIGFSIFNWNKVNPDPSIEETCVKLGGQIQTEIIGEHKLSGIYYLSPSQDICGFPISVGLCRNIQGNNPSVIIYSGNGKTLVDGTGDLTTLYDLTGDKNNNEGIIYPQYKIFCSQFK